MVPEPLIGACPLIALSGHGTRITDVRFTLQELLLTLLRLVPPIGGSENAVDALFGFGYSVFLPRSQSAQSRLRKEG